MTAENHAWFHKQSPAAQAEMNRVFQKYKECQVVVSDEIEIETQIAPVELVIEERKQSKGYDRSKKKEKDRQLENEYWNEK